MRGGNSGCQIETVTSRVFCRTGQARRIGEAQALDAREAQGPRPNLAVGSRMMILEMALDVPRTPVAAGSVMPGGNGDAPGTFGLAFSASGRLTGSGDSLPNRVAGSPGRRVAGSPGRRVAGSPGRRVAGSPGRRVAGSPSLCWRGPCNRHGSSAPPDTYAIRRAAGRFQPTLHAAPVCMPFTPRCLHSAEVP